MGWWGSGLSVHRRCFHSRGFTVMRSHRRERKRKGEKEHSPVVHRGLGGRGPTPESAVGDSEIRVSWDNVDCAKYGVGESRDRDSYPGRHDLVQDIGEHDGANLVKKRLDSTNGGELVRVKAVGCHGSPGDHRRQRHVVLAGAGTGGGSRLQPFQTQDSFIRQRIHDGIGKVNHFINDALGVEVFKPKPQSHD
nr:hypothetical protein Iba_chr10eCG14100 [Ipomoea batatas]